MSDTFGNLLRFVNAGVSGGSNLLREKRALSSVTGHFLINNANHMGDEYGRRSRWAHPGFVGFYAGAPSTVTGRDPRASDLDWVSPATGRTANAMIGALWVVPAGATMQLPRAVLRCRARCGTKTGSKTGLYFAVTPGVGLFPSDTSSSASTIVTSSSLADQELIIELAQEDLAPLTTTPSTGSTVTGVPPLAAPVRLQLCTAWFAAWSIWNDNDPTEVSDVFGLTVGLEP